MERRLRTKPNYNSNISIGSKPPPQALKTVNLASYYPELFSSEGNINAGRFATDQLAIEYFQYKYKDDLKYVIRETDEAAEIWISSKIKKT